MGQHEALFVHDDQIVHGLFVEFQLLQVKAHAEDSILIIGRCAVSNNRLHIANLLAIFVRKVKLITLCNAVAAHCLLLIEVQAENHVADLAAG